MVQLTNKLNDLVSVSGLSFAVVEIKREGMDLYAVIRVNADSSANIIRTFFDRRFAFTAMNDEIRKAMSFNAKVVEAKTEIVINVNGKGFVTIED